MNVADAAGPGGPFAVLSAAFDRDADREKPLREREPITAALEAMLADAIAAVGPDTFFEVGAFEAAFSRQVKAAYPDARVVAVEANPRVHAAFAKEVEEAGVTYLAAAVGESVGTTSFYIPETIAGKAMPFVGRMGSLYEVGLRDSSVVSVQTALTTLDTVAGDLTGRNVCLWIDVEGAVDKVLAGGRETLKSTSLVYCELETRPVWRNQTLSGPVLQHLVDAGFVPLARDCQKWFQFNALFARPEHLDRLGGLVEAYVAKALDLYGTTT